MKKILVKIIERHADEASFLWERRERACRSPLFDLESLTELDIRLAANLEGLVIAGQEGLRITLQALEQGKNAELFTAAHVAAELGDAMSLAQCLAIAEKRRGGELAAISALAWLSPTRAASILGELLANECPPALQRIGLAAYGARRQDPGDTLERALVSSNAMLRATAARVAGELGRRDLLPLLGSEAETGSGEAAIWAAWSAVLLGDGRALPRLWAAALGGGVCAIDACDLAVRCVEAVEAAARLEELSRSPTSRPAALAGATALGSSACIPWVLNVMEHDATLSRHAMWVVATITGARLEPPLAVRTPTVDPPDEAVERSVTDPWQDLPTPSCEALRAHWEEVLGRYAPDKRWLGGRVIEPISIEECLRVGLQPWRASAAIERMLRTRQGGLFPVTMPARGQIALLR